MKKIMTFIIMLALTFSVAGTAYGNGYKVTSELWIRAVIDTREKGPVEAVWEKGGEDSTAAGDQVIWGYFYASPDDVSWGSLQNPDLFVKIWFDRGGRVDVNFFHVSVPGIDVYSDYPYDGTPDEHATATMSRRYIRQYYKDSRSNMDVTYEDGEAPAGYQPFGNPSGHSITDDLRIGTVINTLEKGGIDAVWRKGGEDATEDGHKVVWGHFYANPDDVSWGSENNPDLFVKIWFDASGRTDVNFFHVSVPDIEVFSAFPDNGNYDQKGTTILDNRYIRHEYQRDFEIKEFALTSDIPSDNCESPVSGTFFSNTVDEVNVWISYLASESGKSYRFEWYNPEGVLVLNQTGAVKGTGNRCSWRPITTRKLLEDGGSGIWTVKFYYDDEQYREHDFEFRSGSAGTPFSITDFVLTSKLPPAGCEAPVSETSFSDDVNKVYAYVDYLSLESEKFYEFKWYGPNNDEPVQSNSGSSTEFSNGCSYTEILNKTLRNYGTGQWRVEFYYDYAIYGTEYFTYGQK